MFLKPHLNLNVLLFYSWWCLLTICYIYTSNKTYCTVGCALVHTLSADYIVTSVDHVQVNQSKGIKSFIQQIHSECWIIQGCHSVLFGYVVAKVASGLSFCRKCVIPLLQTRTHKGKKEVGSGLRSTTKQNDLSGAPWWDFWWDNFLFFSTLIT